MPARDNDSETSAATSSIVVDSLMTFTAAYRCVWVDVDGGNTSAARLTGEHPAPSGTGRAARAPVDCADSKYKFASGPPSDLPGFPLTLVSSAVFAPDSVPGQTSWRFRGHRPRHRPGGIGARARR